MWNYAENRSIACVDLNIRSATKMEKRPLNRGSMLERATDNGKCIANGTACDREYRVDVIRVHDCVPPPPSPVRMYASSWPDEIAQFIYCIRNRESFDGRKEGKPVSRDTYARRYCPDKAVRFCSRTSAAVRQYGSMNTCLSTRFTRHDYRTKKTKRVRERIECAVRLPHLVEYVEEGDKELWKDRGMIDTWTQGVRVNPFFRK